MKAKEIYLMVTIYFSVNPSAALSSGTFHLSHLIIISSFRASVVNFVETPWMRFHIFEPPGVPLIISGTMCLNSAGDLRVIKSQRFV